MKHASVAKISRPFITGIAPRKRLFDLLDISLRRPVVWVSAPAGSGKTTLVASYIDSRRLPCLWYQIDSGDSDLATFFYYMGLAAKKANPRKKKPLPLLTPEYFGGIPVFTRRYFEELYGSLTHLSSRLTRYGFIIVFDYYQEAPADSPFHDMLANGLEAIPDRINVVIVSRHNPPVQFARLRANNRMDVIGWDDIRFTVEETEELLRAAEQQSDCDTMAKSLHEKTDGWAAGLALMLGATERQRNGMASEKQAHHGLVFDYFAAEIFDRTDKETQEFLLKTAVFPEFTLPMAESLTMNANSGGILSIFRRNNFFINLSRDSVYSYHALFREFLNTRGKNFFNPVEMYELKKLAGLILERERNPESAARLFIECGDMENLISLIMKNASEMLLQGRYRTLAGWLSSVDKAVIAANPWLLYWSGDCKSPFNAEEAGYCFDQAFHKFKTIGEFDGALLSWTGAVETIFFERGDFSRMDKWAERLDGIMKSNRFFPSADIEIPVVRGMMEIILSRMPDHAEAGSWLKRAIRLIEGDISIDGKLAIASPLHLYCAYSGDHATASFIVRALEPSISNARPSPLSKIRWHLIKAVNANIVAASFSECMRHVEEGIELSKQTGINLLQIPLYQTGAYASLIERDFERTKRLLQEMQLLIKPLSYFDIGNSSSIRLDIDLSEGEYFSAMKHAAETLRMALKTGSPIPIFLTYIGMAQVFLEKGQIKMASAPFAQARRISKGIRNFQWEFLLSLTEAYREIIKGNETKAVGYLQRAMKTGSRHCYLNTIHWNPKMMSILCAKALDHGIEVDYVRHLIRKRNIPPPLIKGVKGDFIDLWPYPVKICTLGWFEILKDESPVTFSGRVQQKPLSLLKAIIASSGSDAPVQKLSDDLWPDADGDKAAQSFKFTLHALRKLLGSEAYIQLKEGRLTLNPDYCMVDVWQLQGLLSRIDSSASDAGIAKLCEQAMNLYRGDFLADEMQGWAAPLRERLKHKLIRTIDRMCDYYEKTGEYGCALKTCQKALELDNLQEDFYRRLMLCYMKLGRRADALAAYQRCKNILSAALGVEPSTKTEDIHRTIRSIK